MMAMSCAIFSYAQVSGTILDASDNTPLIGATVMYVGSTTGTLTDVDGNFTLDGSGDKIEISYVGYATKVLDTNGGGSLGMIKMETGGIGLTEIVVTGTMDIVKDRRTPVAVSTISAAEIQAKVVGNVELGEVAKATPSVFIANQAGGYGDSEVWTRGFDQSNTAFLLNGQPINGMEDGKMYWSNWSGLTDVASAVQIQRGLGASKLAISSVGGTWNFVMKATDREKGGSVFTTIGNDAYRKAGVSYSTGLSKKGLAVTMLLSAWSGDGWAYGTRGQGQTYFLSAGYKPNENHSINFLVTGAPQWHDQKFQFSIFDHEDANGDIDRKYNSNWGIYQGQYFTERRNYYHKPVMNLNWDWKIDDKSDFGMVLYGSFGRGGGTGGLGGSKVRTQSGLINFDQTRADSTGYLRRASVNNHNWFGSVLKYNRKLSNNLNLSVGADLRSYYGDHFRQVVDLISSDGVNVGNSRGGWFANTEYEANPWSALTNYADRNDRIAYNNGEHINYQGLFGQIEYNNDAFTAYLQGALSSQNYQRHEYFYESLENEDSEKITRSGYNLKLGLSYSLNQNHILFANAGQYSRQPFFDVSYVGFTNTVAEGTKNETITGFEAGYKYLSNDLYVNINGYYTLWSDRVFQSFYNGSVGDTVQLLDGSDYLAIDDPFENSVQEQRHIGVELDLGYQISDKFKLSGFASLGDWVVVGAREVTLFDDTPRREIQTYTTDGEDVAVGGAPQTSFGLGARYNFTRNFSTELQYLYYDRLFARNGGIQLPSYGLMDLNLSYAIPLEDNILRIGANIYNITDSFYISKSRTSNEADASDANNWNGINRSNQVTFGKGRTWNFSLKYSF